MTDYGRHDPRNGAAGGRTWARARVVRLAAGGHRGQLLALQGLAGNRATGQLIARLRKSDGLPEHAGLDLAPLLAAQVPELLPLIPADQIEAMQALYDAHASNAELDRRVRAKKNEMRTHGVDPESGSEYSRAQIAKVPGEYKSEDGPLSFQIRTEDVLSDDILQEPPRNKAAEMAFRKWMREELLKSPTVTVSIQANRAPATRSRPTAARTPMQSRRIPRRPPS